MGGAIKTAWRERIDFLGVLDLSFRNYYTPKGLFYPNRSEDQEQQQKIIDEHTRLIQDIQKQYKILQRQLHADRLIGLPQEYTEQGTRLFYKVEQVKEELLAPDNFEQVDFKLEDGRTIFTYPMIAYLINLQSPHAPVKQPEFKAELDTLLSELSIAQKVSRMYYKEIRDLNDALADAKLESAQLEKEIKQLEKKLEPSVSSAKEAHQEAERLRDELQTAHENHEKLVRFTRRNLDILKAYERVTPGASPGDYLDTIAAKNQAERDLTSACTEMAQVRPVIRDLTQRVQEFTDTYHRIKKPTQTP